VLAFVLATVTLEAVSFRAYASPPALLPFFKCMLEVVFCEGVHHRLSLCLDHLSCVKITAFQFYFQSVKQRKVELFGTTVVLFSVKYSSVKKEV
jgi:hypothetical protein